MMSESNTIDIIAKDKETGKILLVMTEHRPWNETIEMHDQFLKKTNLYMNYILSEGFKAKFPNSTPVDVIIKLDCVHAPGNETLTLFQQVKTAILKHGVDFKYEVFS